MAGTTSRAGVGTPTSTSTSAATFASVLATELGGAAAGSLLGGTTSGARAGLSGGLLTGTAGLSTAGLGTTAGLTALAPRAATAVAPTTGVPTSATGAQVVSAALDLVGTPYVFGGSTAQGIDCSGLVQHAYRQVGVEVPHSSQAIRDVGTVIPREQAQPGDVIWSPGHVSIYLGDDMQVEASRPGGWDVAVREIWQDDPVFLRLT